MLYQKTNYFITPFAKSMDLEQFVWLGLDPGTHLGGPIDKSIDLERKNKSFRAGLA